MRIDKVIGFTILRDCADRAGLAEKAQAKLLADFPWLTSHSFRLSGELRVSVWGHGSLSQHVHRESDGSAWIMSNSNLAPNWAQIVDAHRRDPKTLTSHIALEGIFVLARISHGMIELWNDWTGASKAFLWASSKGHGVSTLEPVAVAAAGAGDTDVSPSALVSLMRVGAFCGTSTLYRTIQLLPPDSYGCLDANGLRSSRMNTIRASDRRWSAGWDEVIEEWKELFHDTFAELLAPAAESTLMLSGGIDSRLIAAIGLDHGHRFHAVSYGNRVWQDGVFAAKLASTLGLKLMYYTLEPDHLTVFTKPWCDWFGASMCVHGMYQLPALVGLRRDGGDLPITTGFTGDPLEGMQIAMLMRDEPGARPTILRRLARKLTLWTDDEIARLIPSIDVPRACEELESDLQSQYDSLEGADYQRMWFIFQWNRMFQFSSYQPIMYEYHFGVITPFVHSKLANFTLSLPRYALEGRRTVLEMIKRHFPKLAKLPGTFDHPSQVFDFIPSRFGIPLLLSKSYLARAAIGYALPKRLRIGPFREFWPGENVFARDAVRADGIRALYPLDRVPPSKQSWFEPRELERTIASVLADDHLYASHRLWPIQTVLHRFAT